MFMIDRSKYLKTIYIKLFVKTPIMYVIKSSPINIICYVQPPICSLVLSDIAVGGVAQGRL